MGWTEKPLERWSFCEWYHFRGWRSCSFSPSALTASPPPLPPVADAEATSARPQGKLPSQSPRRSRPMPSSRLASSSPSSTRPRPCQARKRPKRLSRVLATRLERKKSGFLSFDVMKCGRLAWSMEEGEWRIAAGWGVREARTCGVGSRCRAALVGCIARRGCPRCNRACFCWWGLTGG